MAKTFGIIGVGGFVAPRHLQAIKQNNGTLLCALDVHDSVGILDSYFPQADFFTHTERFERHINKLKNTNKALDYMSICSPNHLHDSHIRLALHNNAHAICEKPLVLNPWNLDTLMYDEQTSQKRIFSILQLRLHPSIIALKNHVQTILQTNPNATFDITLSYITSRGKWYFHSWKGDEEKSGGVATNIGIHFFDMLLWIFGKVQKSIIHTRDEKSVSGFLELTYARVRWLLSIDEAMLPESAHNKRVYRSLMLGDEEFAFSDGFNDLHTQSYAHILEGKGFGIEESRGAIELVHSIRHSTPCGLKGDFHPMLSTQG